MIELEPEFITIIEGPTPQFQPAPFLWMKSIYEGPSDASIAQCELRTMNGDDIMERCREAWEEGRPVVLEYPDDMRLPQEVDVVAMRLHEVDAGAVLRLWVRWPLDEDAEEDDITGFGFGGFDE